MLATLGSSEVLAQMELARSRILMASSSATDGNGLDKKTGIPSTSAPLEVSFNTGGAKHHPESFGWNDSQGLPQGLVTTAHESMGKSVRVQDSPLFDRKIPETPWQQEEEEKHTNASESMMNESPSVSHAQREGSPLQDSYHSLPSSLHSSRTPSARRDYSSPTPHKRHSAPSPRSSVDMSLNPDRIHVTVLPERQGLIFKHTKYHIQCPQVGNIHGYFIDTTSNAT
jgi:hypothetical protein